MRLEVRDKHSSEKLQRRGAGEAEERERPVARGVRDRGRQVRRDEPAISSLEEELRLTVKKQYLLKK